MPSLSRTVVLTTSFPHHEGDPCGHFVQSELPALPPGPLHVLAPSPNGHGGVRRERREHGGRRFVVHWLDGGEAFGWPGVAARLRERPQRALQAVRYVAAARALLHTLAPQVVVAHWALPSAWPIAPGRAAALHIVSHGGDVRLLCALPAPLRRQLVTQLLRRCQEWRFVSDSLRQQLECALPQELAHGLRSKSRVQAANLDLEVDHATALRLRASVPEGPLHVAVGRLVPSKRVDRIVRHLAAQPAPGTLVVVGDGPERPRLEALARDHGVPARFVGTRPRPEALAWIAAADRMYFASDAEGASSVLREASRLGTEVVELGA